MYRGAMPIRSRQTSSARRMLIRETVSCGVGAERPWEDAGGEKGQDQAGLLALRGTRQDAHACLAHWHQSTHVTTRLAWVLGMGCRSSTQVLGSCLQMGWMWQGHGVVGLRADSGLTPAQPPTAAESRQAAASWRLLGDVLLLFPTLRALNESPAPPSSSLGAPIAGEEHCTEPLRPGTQRHRSPQGSGSYAASSGVSPRPLGIPSCQIHTPP